MVLVSERLATSGCVCILKVSVPPARPASWRSIRCIRLGFANVPLALKDMLSACVFIGLAIWV